MRFLDFAIGTSFWTEVGEFRCTDIGTRVVVAVRITAKVKADPSWLNGPPYAIAETVFDENDFAGCFKRPPSDSVSRQVRASAARMVRRHRKSLEKLGSQSGSSESPRKAPKRKAAKKR